MIISLEAPKLTEVDLVSDVQAMLGQAVPLEDREGGRFHGGEISHGSSHKRPLTATQNWPASSSRRLDPSTTT
jgi:hypothetical protein